MSIIDVAVEPSIALARTKVVVTARIKSPPLEKSSKMIVNCSSKYWKNVSLRQVVNASVTDGISRCCQHIRRTGGIPGQTIDIWFAQGVGMLKRTCAETSTSEVLTRYTIQIEEDNGQIADQKSDRSEDHAIK